jgi:hypothetical protein
LCRCVEELAREHMLKAKELALLKKSEELTKTKLTTTQTGDKAKKEMLVELHSKVGPLPCTS